METDVTNKDMKSVDFDLNMSVPVAAKLPKDIAYWCIPGYQTDGLKPGFKSYIWSDNTGFALPEVITFKLNYPFDEAYIEKASLVRESKWKKADGTEVVDKFRSDSVGEIVWLGAQAYLNAFKWAKENDIGYWHGMGDLVFEGMTIYEDGTIDFFVGS